MEQAHWQYLGDFICHFDTSTHVLNRAWFRFEVRMNLRALDTVSLACLS